MKFNKDYLFGKTPDVRFVECSAENRFGETKALFYDGENYRGKRTTVFAYLGIPEKCARSDGKFPAVVLVHGGGGAAFYEWVEYWNGKGYIAIAPDFCGRQFGTHKLDGQIGFGKIPDNPDAGPLGYGSFDSAADDFENSWVYHCICDIIFAHNILRSMPEVDSDKTVVTGISWGGVLTCIASGVDDRFRAFAPVYGCGFFCDIPGTRDAIKSIADVEAWRSCYDPSSYLPYCTKPILFTIGTDEFFFEIGKANESAALCRGPAYYSYHETLAHYHRWKDEEGMIAVYEFLDSMANDRPLPIDIHSEMREDTLHITLGNTDSHPAASLVYASEMNGGAPGGWKSFAVDYTDAGDINVRIPAEAKAFFAEFTLTSNGNDCTFSTQLFCADNK